ncbi:MAG: alkaline phosphatase family protein [Rhizobiales bacterium 62-17]|nr:alkaline phosphatase family protein [Hyphomicrobiales bacterium]OJY04078.1 MAG: alkaline phosphatase family protein [Rhizobiales bacterium 62-17]
MRRSVLTLGALCALAQAAVAADRPHNIVLFVADGLRPGMVNENTAPAIAALWKQGVHFTNTHSMFPTFTTANASAMATGHKLGDTGDFSNTIDAGFQVPGAGNSLTPFLESDPVLADVDEHFAGDYLNQETVMKAARQAGISTATVGKLGPALIFDHTERSGGQTVTIDDMTGRAGGVPLSAEVQQRLKATGLALEAPGRGDNGQVGDMQKPGTLQANVTQQDYFLNAATKVVLPLFKERAKPFMLVFWSRDPDGTQHNQGDSLNRLIPGINGPTSLAAIRNADHDLAELLATLKALGLEETTDVIITADHGFSTISKESATSFAAAQGYKDVLPNFLPIGFLAIDLAHGLDMPLLDPDAKYASIAAGAHPSKGNALIGGDQAHPKVVVAANGGSDLVYIPDGDCNLARQVVDILSAQDYVSGLFVSDDLGPIPGTLPISAIDLKGSAVTPIPSIVVNFRSFSTGCADPLTCGVEVADTVLQQGQGMHGSFSRADTAVIGGALGPDFRKAFVDPAPVSNADIGKTMARILGLRIKDVGKLVGRVTSEAMPNGAMPKWQSTVQVSAPDARGQITKVAMQVVGTTRYFDAAGYPGRTLGLLDQPLSRR